MSFSNLQTLHKYIFLTIECLLGHTNTLSMSESINCLHYLLPFLLDNSNVWFLAAPQLKHKKTQAPLRDEYILTYRTHWKCCFSLPGSFLKWGICPSLTPCLPLFCWNAAYFRKLECHQTNWDLESRSCKLKFMVKAHRSLDPQVFPEAAPHILGYLSPDLLHTKKK